MDIPLEHRMREAKKIYGEMWEVKSKVRDWYLARQYRAIRKIKKMMEETPAILLRDAKNRYLEIYDTASPLQLQVLSNEINRLKKLV